MTPRVSQGRARYAEWLSRYPVPLGVREDMKEGAQKLLRLMSEDATPRPDHENEIGNEEALIFRLERHLIAE